MNDLKFNAEGYRDPTSYLAFQNILREEEKKKRRRRKRRRKRKQVYGSQRKDRKEMSRNAGTEYSLREQLPCEEVGE